MDQQLLRSLGIEGDLDVDSSTTKGGPGKSTLTSKLTPAPQVVFRVADPETARALGESLGSGSRPRIQREADGASGARDGNGVMAGAEAAVDRAASSSGAPLPTHIQRQFEGSLGADLSGVRVHTGSESQEAAHAVGAKAYTVGNDIHFAAGRYQPDDPFGMHLLAHEVAHTVQQSGGAQRRQNKLEVSTPHDAAEHEADRAADAMVRGEAATVSGMSGLARKVLQRDPTDEGEEYGPASPQKMADAADEVEKKAKSKTGGSSDLGDVSAVTVDTKAQADKVASLINGASSNLETGISNGDVQPSVRTANQTALGQLALYGDALDTDKFNNDSFIQQAQALGADFARLHAQMMTLDKSGQSGGQLMAASEKLGPGAQRGDKMGRTIIDVSGGGSAAELNKGFKESVTAKDGAARVSGNAATHWSNAQKCQKDMDDAAQKVAESGRDIMPKQLAAQSATANIKAMAAAAEVGKYQSEIDKLKADAAAAEEKVKLVGGTIKNAAAIGFAATDAKGPNIGAMVGAAIDMVTNLVAYSAKHWNDGDIEDKEEKKKVAKANEIFQRANEAAKNAQKTLQELQNTSTKYYESLTALDTAKTKYREAMELMGNSMDKAQGGNAYSICAQVLSEAEPYLVQSKLTIETGRTALGKLPKEAGGQRFVSTASGSIIYYLAIEPPDKHTYFAARGTLTMKGALPNGGPLADVLSKALAKMEEERSEIDALAKSLRAVFKV